MKAGSEAIDAPFDVSIYTVYLCVCMCACACVYVCMCVCVYVCVCAHILQAILPCHVDTVGVCCQYELL